METNDFSWSAADFFKSLTEKNRLAAAEGFAFCVVSSLDGFEDALAGMQQSLAFVCVSDTADGYTSLVNSPRTRRVKTVFMAMRHCIDDMQAREKCFDTMRELFRQFMSVLIREKTRLENRRIFIDEHISFSEIPQYFFSGCACAFFNISVDCFTNLMYNPDEWIE